jgi:hypothetical protein
VPGGGNKLVFSLRELADAEPSFCVAGLDISNAFNTVHQASIIELLKGAGPELAPYACLAQATLGPKASIFSAVDWQLKALHFSGEEGVQQGSVWRVPTSLPLPFKGPSRLLTPSCARTAGQRALAFDDVQAVGHPSVVFQAVDRFKQAVAASLGL